MLPPASHPDLVSIEVWHGFGLGRFLLTRGPAGRREQRREKGEWSIREVGRREPAELPWCLPLSSSSRCPKCSSRVCVEVCFWNPDLPVLS